MVPQQLSMLCLFENLQIYSAQLLTEVPLGILLNIQSESNLSFRSAPGECSHYSGLPEEATPFDRGSGRELLVRCPAFFTQDR